MNSNDFERVRDEYARRYPPMITIDQAVEIAQHAGPGTIYDWSSRGLFDGFKSKRGKYVRLIRDEFIRFLFTDSKR